MEDQGKRLLIAVVLALGIVVLWNVVFPSSQSKKPNPAQDIAEPTPTELQSPVGRPQGGAEAPAPAGGIEHETSFHYKNVDVTFSDRDARITSWQLLDPKYDRDENKGQMVADPELGELQTNFTDSQVVIPLGTVWSKKADADEQPNEVTYTYDAADLSVTKTFHIHPDDYLVDVTVEATLKNKDTATAKLAIRTSGHQNKNIVKAGRVTRETRAACHINGDVSQIPAHELATKPNERGGDIRWVGFNHPYLFLAVSPRTDGHNQNFACNAYADLSVEGGMEVDLVYPQAVLSKDKPFKWSATSFIGPKHLSALEHADDVAGFSTDFDQSVNMGPWLGYLAHPLLLLLLWLQGFVGNWGVAIILLTVVVKVATLYWTTKSMRSMRAMSALKPKIDELNKKHGDDKQRVQQEMMALYKQHGVNPLSGCLPMLLQMPIWLALYRMLSSAGELYLAPFIPGWINDLTATDPFHIMPVLLIGMMFLSSRLSPAQVDGFQQKMMVYGMPLIFGVMSFFFPAGLTIYILTNTTLSLLHTLYMKKFDKSAKLVMAVKPAAASSGKSPPPKTIDVEADEVEDDDDGDDEPAAKAPAQRKTTAQRRKRKRRN